MVGKRREEDGRRSREQISGKERRKTKGYPRGKERKEEGKKLLE